MPNLKPIEIVIIAVVLLVLFGSTKIPKFARSLGQAQKELRKGLDEGLAEGDDEDSSTSA